MKNAAIAILGLALVLSMPGAAAATVYAEQATINRVMLVTQQLEASTVYTFYAESDLGAYPDSDPVMHILSPSGVEVSMANDCGFIGCSHPKDPRITYVPPVTGPYTIVVRSKTDTSYGRVQLYRNGAAVGTLNLFGGQHAVAAAAGSDIRVTAQSRTASGCNDPMVYLLSSAGSIFRAIAS